MDSHEIRKAIVELSALVGLAVAIGFGISEHLELGYTRGQLSVANAQSLLANEKVEKIQDALDIANAKLQETDNRSEWVVSALEEKGCGTGQLPRALIEITNLQAQLNTMQANDLSLAQDKSTLAFELKAAEQKLASAYRSSDDEISIQKYNALVDQYNSLVNQSNSQDKKRVADYNALVQKFNDYVSHVQTSMSTYRSYQYVTIQRPGIISSGIRIIP